MSKNNPNHEAIISKLLTMLEPSEEEIRHRELMRKNGHPLVVRAMEEKDHYIKNVLHEQIERKSNDAKDAVLALIFKDGGSSALELLKAISIGVIKEYCGAGEAEKAAMFYMNDTKEHLLHVFSKPIEIPGIFNEPILYQFESGADYIASLESYQTAYLVNLFAVETPKIVEESFREAKQQISSMLPTQKFTSNHEISDLRKVYKMSSSAMSKDLGVRQSQLVKWISGEEEPTMTIEEMRSMLEKSRSTKESDRKKNKSRSDDEKWDDSLDEVMEWINDNGRLPKQNSLGIWIRKQQVAYKNGELSAEKIQKIRDSVPIVLDDDGSYKDEMRWERGFKKEMATYEKVGKSSNSASNRWVREQRDVHKNKELSKERYEKIVEAIPDFFNIEKLKKQRRRRS